MTPKLSIVIPVLKGTHQLSRLLQSLYYQENAPAFDIHVVFNPSPDRFLNPGFTAQQLKIWCNRKKGVNAARNMGAHFSCGAWIYFLDADCELTNRKHLHALDEKLQAADWRTIHGGPYRMSQPTSRASRAYHLIQCKWLHEGAHTQYGWVNLPGGNLAVSRQVFEHQQFDDSIAFGSAETGFIAQWLQSGGKGRMCEELGVDHNHHLRKGDLVRKAFLQGFGFQYLQARGQFVTLKRHSLLASAEQRELSDLIQLYKDSYRAGQYYFDLYGGQAPTRLKMKWFLLGSFKSRPMHP
jgi:hypothetical protein